ncbi:MAG: hypothetical protein R3288_01005, partial [Woeseiaceae bacterium]|nr:hypothetical protein [Woeseiaceae bacterium]
MKIVDLIARPLYWLAGKIFSLWARPAIQPETPAELITESAAEVCYVLETGGLADLLALERACARSGMPSPTESFEYGKRTESRRVVTLMPQQGFVAPRPSHNGSPRHRRQVETGVGGP